MCEVIERLCLGEYLKRSCLGEYLSVVVWECTIWTCLGVYLLVWACLGLACLGLFGLVWECTFKECTLCIEGAIVGGVLITTYVMGRGGMEDLDFSFCRVAKKGKQVLIES